jgi:PAS domain S-box-containing protein
MRKDKSKSKHADDRSSHAEKQLKREKTRSFQNMAEEEQIKLLRTLNKREKELNCLYRLSKLIEKPGITLEGIFERLVNLIPLAWQYPEITCTKIIFGNKEFKADNFKDTKWKQSADLMVYVEKVGCVQVCYLEEKPESYEGPFLKEERDLLEAVTGLLGRIIERKKVEDELGESKAKFRDFLDHISDGIYRLNKDGYFTFVNKVIVDRSGIPPEKFYTLHFLDIVIPEDHELVKRNVERVMGGEEENPYELSYKRADGRIIKVEVHAKPIYEGGIVVGLQGISRDITERKKMEELLRESEYRFRSIFDLSPQAIVLTELETGKIFDVNNKFCELTRYDKREFLGRTSIEIGYFSKDERNKFIKELKSKGYVHGLEKDFRSKDGSVLNLLMFSKIIQRGSDNFILNIFVDITERKQAEEELLQYRKHLEEMVKERTEELEKANKETRLYQKKIEALINSSKDLILLKNKDFKYLIANKAHEKLFDIRVSDIIGKTDFDFMPKELAELCRKNDKNALISKDPIESEEPFGDGVYHVIRQRVIDEKGEIIGIAAIIRDITTHKNTERELTEAKERFQTLSSSLLKIMEDQQRHIARELHDEIGQQLTVLKINLQNAQQLSNSKEYLTPLNETMAIVESLVQLVRNLLLELRPSVLDDLGLVPALRMYVKRLEQEAGVVIDFVADSLYHRFPTEIENACFRVAQEALTNAIKHSKAQKVGIELRQMENKLQLTILDDGIGFDAQSALEQAKMGRSFGLLGIHERIFLTGGTIKIESTPGKGTKIHAYFPLNEDS